jgi:hypothetical protein
MGLAGPTAAPRPLDDCDSIGINTVLNVADSTVPYCGRCPLVWAAALRWQALEYYTTALWLSQLKKKVVKKQ